MLVLRKKKRFVLSFITTFVILGFLFGICKSIPTNDTSASVDSRIYPSVTNNRTRRALQEVAFAYYVKGSNIQYESARRNAWIAPEQITSQAAGYHVCSGFTFAVNYEAYKIIAPPVTAMLMSYARDYHDSSDDIIYYKKQDNMMNTVAKRKSIFNTLVSKAEVGDTFAVYKTTDGDASGHEMLIYDFVYDGSGNRADAVILHSTGTSKTKDSVSTRITRGLQWNNTLNDTTGVAEGTIQKTLLSQILRVEDTHNTMNTITGSNYLTLYRPTAYGDSQYNKIACNDDSSQDLKYTCTGQLKNYSEPAATTARLKYSGIEIEKTVDAFNGSVVQPGEKLTYSVKITNHSSSAYSDIVVTNAIQEDLVDSISGEPNTTIKTIAAGTSKTVTYSVTLKDGSSLLGNEVISTGTVAGIESATIKNKIGHNLTKTEKSAILSAYNNLKTSYSGLELVDKIYEQALGKNLNLSNGFVLGAHYDRASNTSDVKKRNKCNPWLKSSILYEDAQNNPDEALITTFWGKTYSSLDLNDNHRLSKAVLNNYYSALHTTFGFENDGVTCMDSGAITPKFWSNYYSFTYSGAHMSDRAVRIYPETLQTGDILIYQNADFKNSNGSVNPDSKTGENGVYAYVWIETQSTGKLFLGRNKRISDGKLVSLNKVFGVNEAYPGKTTIDDDSFNLFTLFGKDYYAIIRPSLLFAQNVTFQKNSIIKTYGDAAFTNIAATSGDAPITYESSNVDVAKVNKNTGKVTITGAGVATITAMAGGVDLHDESSATYSLTVNKGMPSISFENATISKYVNEGEFANLATTNSDGEIHYNSDNQNVAIVDSVSGEVTIKGIGSATITANVSATNNYESASTSYLLTVRDNAEIVSFENTSIIKKYGDAMFINPAVILSDGIVTYSSDNTGVAVVDNNTGEVTIMKAGVAQITVNVAATTNYPAASATYSLTVNKRSSVMPDEVSEIKNGYASNKLSTIVFDTIGLAWEDGNLKIVDGYNDYAVRYTQNADVDNYTTESYTITVNGSHKIYDVIVGDKQVYLLDENEYLSFTINADYGVFENGGEVYIDRELLNSDYYTSSFGSTVINIDNSYLGNLSDGQHNITVYFNDGGVAAATFVIAKSDGDENDEEEQDSPEPYSPSAPDDPVVPDTPSPSPSQEDADTAGSSPDTGESTRSNENNPISIITVPSIAIFLAGLSLQVYKKRAKHIKFN